MGFVEGDGPGSAARHGNHIVYTKVAVKLPTGLVVCREYGMAGLRAASAAKPYP